MNKNLLRSICYVLFVVFSAYGAAALVMLAIIGLLKALGL